MKPDRKARKVSQEPEERLAAGRKLCFAIMLCSACLNGFCSQQGAKERVLNTRCLFNVQIVFISQQIELFSSRTKTDKN